MAAGEFWYYQYTPWQQSYFLPLWDKRRSMVEF